ncbi:MAG: efflux RND transporter periplasmic adaptor subunit [Planctomycetota bacterium]
MKPLTFAIVACIVAGLVVAGYRAAASRGGPDPVASLDPGASGLENGARARAGKASPAPESRVAAKALGKLEAASEEIGVASDLTGRIVEILVEEGDSVSAGQALARLDDTLYRAKVAAAEAALKAAKARRQKLQAGARIEAIRKAQALLEAARAQASIAREKADRGEKLSREGVMPHEEASWLLREAESREAQVRAFEEELSIIRNETRPEDLAAAVADEERAEKELEAAKAELSKAILRSPIDGAVVRRNLRVGEAVSSFQVEPIVTVADLSRLRVRAEVDEIDLASVRLGQRACAESESFPGRRLCGTVVRLGRTMGRKTVKGSDPNERQDVRVREVLIDLDEAADLPLGLRLVVSFLE